MSVNELGDKKNDLRLTDREVGAAHIPDILNQNLIVLCSGLRAEIACSLRGLASI